MLWHVPEICFGNINGFAVKSLAVLLLCGMPSEGIGPPNGDPSRITLQTVLREARKDCSVFTAENINYSGDASSLAFW